MTSSLAAMDSSSDENDSEGDTDSSDTEKDVAKPPRKIRKLLNTSTVRASEYPAISHSGTSSDLCDDQSLLGLSNDESGDGREQDVGNNSERSPTLAEVQVSC